MDREHYVWGASEGSDSDFVSVFCSGSSMPLCAVFSVVFSVVFSANAAGDSLVCSVRLLCSVRLMCSVRLLCSCFVRCKCRCVVSSANAAAVLCPVRMLLYMCVMFGVNAGVFCVNAGVFCSV